MDDAGAPSQGGAHRIGPVLVARRARNVAVWSIALFVAFVPVALLGGGMGDEASVQRLAGRALALVFGVAGFAVSVVSFVLAFRHWDILPPGTRWLASLPLLVIAFLVALSTLLAVIG